MMLNVINYKNIVCIMTKSGIYMTLEPITIPGVSITEKQRNKKNNVEKLI